MAEKKASRIAKEHGIPARELLERLRDAGMTVPMASAMVDEDLVVRTLNLDGSGDAAAQSGGGTATVAPPAPPAAPPAPRPAAPTGDSAPAPSAPAARQGNGNGTPSAPTPPPAAPPRPAQAKGAGPRIIEQPTPRPAAPAPPPARRAAPQQPAPAARGGREGGQQAPRRRDEGQGQGRSGGQGRQGGGRPSDRGPAPVPQAPRPVPQMPPGFKMPVRPPSAPPSFRRPTAAPDAPATPAEAGATAEAATAKADEKPQTQVGEAPGQGRGPKILSVPAPPKRPKRDESANLPGDNPRRPNRGGGAGGPGRRRVVIDGNAARRGPGGGPGGPGGPPQGPPRRQRRGRRRRGVFDDTLVPLDIEAQTSIDKVKVSSGSTVREVAESMGVPVPEMIKKLMLMGEMATLTQTLSDDTIELLAGEFDREIQIVRVGDEEDEAPTFEDAEDDLVLRPPVVTIMGHVDHGKTSLLDAIRGEDVVAGEAGGITQHIGAYQVHRGDEEDGDVVTFLDTPGHQAFTAMRARGAKVTDIAVIVVAADDGVKPQTREAVDHAKAADVPIVVAVNKVDKEGADPTRVRTEMTQLGLQPAEWGGDTEFVDVSAKTRVGLDDLLETLQVVAELLDLRANPDADASGVIIESRLDPGRGAVATMLIQRGTLRITDALVAGSEWARVRAMVDYTGARITEAYPGEPVEILGWDGAPAAGDYARVVEDERTARTQAADRAHRAKLEALARRSGRKMSLEDVFKRSEGGTTKNLPIIIKTDVAGSVEAMEDEIAKLPQDEIFVDVISSGVGGITESDVMLASASEAIILGFNVRPVGDAARVADREGVEIRTYSVIYAAMDELRLAMEGMLEPEEVEEPLGTVEVRQIFRASRIGTIAGSYVTDGLVRRNAKVRVVRDSRVIADTTIEGLKRFNEDAREVQAGYECGITLRNWQDIQEGDVLEVYGTRKVERALA